MKTSYAVFVSLLYFLSVSFVFGDAPDKLMCELLARPEISVIRDSKPEFTWVMNSGVRGDMQTAYQILAASGLDVIEKNIGDVWDSGKVESDRSVSVEYAGQALKPGQTYYWKVRVWDKKGKASEYSSSQMIKTAEDISSYATSTYPLQKSFIPPFKISKKSEGDYLVDFGKVAFGYLVFDQSDIQSDHEIEVYFGERGNKDGIITDLGRTTVRYYKVMKSLKKGAGKVEIHNPRDGRNTGGRAIKLPEEIGIVCPFRYIEIVGFEGEITKEMITQVAVHYTFNEDASSFESSSKVLDDIWELCKYSMKATSFCGVYVDGDRERIPYEADAYINQLSHYGVDREYSIARFSHEYLLEHPTWPTEWKQHSVLMAWADYMYTGDTESLAANYEVLKSEKTLEFMAGKDGLLVTPGGKKKGKVPDRDIVDWPPSERDGYVFKTVNTVVNSFYYKTLLQMSDMAAAIGKDTEANEYAKKAVEVKSVFNKVLFDKKRGLYVDGVGTEHASLHANMMTLAFGLVPEERKKTVSNFVVSKKMACSVYGAQYLMEALYEAGRADAAFDLLVSKDIRSWYNMIRVGSTITLEAWDDKFKPNQDWNHAWGAVPGNIIPRYVLGVNPIEPGFKRVQIKPQLGRLTSAKGTVPTIRGPIAVSFKKLAGSFQADIIIPANTVGEVYLPVSKSGMVTSSDKQPDTMKYSKLLRIEDGFAVYEIGSGNYAFAVN